MSAKRCYIYTRVSTAIQVDGFSLDAQKEKLRRYAEFQEMVVAGEYSDAGKSGKNTDGRPGFRQMLSDIESGKDKINYVLVFKLSRFGRNAADVLCSLQSMQDYGVNLICVEDGIDSSKDSGKLMISVLSAVAEIERENILVQTMEGRRQKAREGKWNGGFAPYGYKLENGELLIAEDEAEVIRLIFDKYVNTTMGVASVAHFLNNHGYIKKQRQNNTLDMFSAEFVRKVSENHETSSTTAFGVTEKQLSTIKRVLSVAAIYGLSDEYAELAYSISQNVKCSLDKACDFVADFILQIENGSVDPCLCLDDIAFISLKYRLSFSEAQNIVFEMQANGFDVASAPTGLLDIYLSEENRSHGWSIATICEVISYMDEYGLSIKHFYDLCSNADFLYDGDIFEAIENYRSDEEMLDRDICDYLLMVLYVLLICVCIAIVIVFFYGAGYAIGQLIGNIQNALNL